MGVRNIYVAATKQHVGKTTSTLGLVTAFKNKGIKVGYCKPVGQQSINFNSIQVDKDALLFSDVMNFELIADIHSPVILGPGATTEFIDHPESFQYRQRIEYAASILEPSKELVIYEGTGHPGVGSVVGLSNADVAKLLDSGVVMIVEGGIGSTIDMLSLCIAKFQQKNVPLLGVIVNKVHEAKLEKVKYYVGKKLQEMKIPLLGVVPYDRSLAFPLLRSICNAVNGVVLHNGDQLEENKVEDIISGSLIDTQKLLHSDDLLLIVSARQVDNALKKIQEICRRVGKEKSPLAGIVATGLEEANIKYLDYINEHKIPVIRTALDSFGVVIKYTQIEVKINRATPWKVAKAIELIEQNVALDYLLEQVDVQLHH